MQPYNLQEHGTVLHNAYVLARAAKAAYRDEPGVADEELGEAFPAITTFRMKRVFGYVAGNADDVIVAFRGTDEDRDWIEALAFGQVAGSGGRVHRGLAEALESVWQQLLAGLYDVEAHEKKMWLAGHSLGGGLATLATQRLFTAGFEPHLTCTFGAPPVLDPQAVKAFPTPLYRVVNNDDMVPGFPWPTLTDTYEHAGELIFLLPSGKVAEGRHSKHLALRIDRAETIGQGVLPSGFLHDHFLGSYISKLQRYA